MVARKHAEFIKAWADGSQIQTMTAFGWRDIGDSPSWLDRNEYRIKPAEPARPPYPKTLMSSNHLAEIAAPFERQWQFEEVANAALRHACDNGQIVTREEFDKVSDEANQFRIWDEKTQWVQAEFSQGHFMGAAGMHRADVMRLEIIRLREEFDRAITARKARDVLVAVAAGRAMYNAIYSVLPIRRDYCDIALDIEAIIAEVK